MLVQDVRSTLRSIRRRPFHSGMALGGLAVGMAAFLFIASWVRFELGFDRFHDKSDRIVRVALRGVMGYMGSDRWAVTPAGFADAIAAQVPGVESVTQLAGAQLVLSTDHPVSSDGLLALPGFFDVFSFPLVRGDRTIVLTTADRIVLTSGLASRLFGHDDPVGRTLDARFYGEPHTLTVTGIMADPPPNSHLQFDFLLSMATDSWYEQMKSNWHNNSWLTYVVLQPGIERSDFDARIDAVAQRHLDDDTERAADPSKRSHYYSQPLLDLHLRSHVNSEIGETGDWRRVAVFSLVGLVLLLIPCANYMSLAVARAAARVRELGIRRVSGATRRGLATQLVIEALVHAAIAGIGAIVLLAVARPWLVGFTGQPVESALPMRAVPILFALATAAVTGLVGGSYPALVVARTDTSRVLRGGSFSDGRGTLVRDGLVAAQFAAGIALVFVALVMRRQLDVLDSYDTGVDRDRVVVVQARDPGLRDRWPALSDALLSTPGVLSVSSANDLPVEIGHLTVTRDWDGMTGDEQVYIYASSVNLGFPELLGLRVVEGRSFSADFPSDDGHALLINETAMRRLGWDTAVGKRIDMPIDGSVVVGVLKDFRFQSLRRPIEPLVFELDTRTVSRVLVRIGPGSPTRTLEGVAGVMARFSPAYPFEYRFLDDAYDAMYRTDLQSARLMNAFTAISLLIACMGLLGILSFAVERRTREIGVRRVLGAGATDLVLLLSRRLAALIGLAFVVGIPLAWLPIDRWLDGFTVSADPGVGTMLLAGLLALLVAAATVATQCVRAATLDPVEALRHE